MSEFEAYFFPVIDVFPVVKVLPLWACHLSPWSLLCPPVNKDRNSITLSVVEKLT